ncbi:MAG TPA: OsmC family protein [Segeticoccus sp.]|uniref:OsmC family protein n=1 Tax=Segeticoccus sp. TaxID=2706531 RepID=UPI002D80BDF4|nr:OsmC family protein [Segeticoccus sp.]HET8598687.1 OsmC family protein [Segeticoccus sp.]
MSDQFEVVVGAGSLRADDEAAVRFAHPWTTEGVTVEADFTGGHLLHVAVAGCVLNDLYRAAAEAGIELAGVRVAASGGFDARTWASTGISYTVDIDSADAPGRLAALLALVDASAEIPRAVRAGASVRRVS